MLLTKGEFKGVLLEDCYVNEIISELYDNFGECETRVRYGNNRNINRGLISPLFYEMSITPLIPKEVPSGISFKFSNIYVDKSNIRG